MMNGVWYGHSPQCNHDHGNASLSKCTHPAGFERLLAPSSSRKGSEGSATGIWGQVCTAWALRAHLLLGLVLFAHESTTASGTGGTFWDEFGCFALHNCRGTLLTFLGSSQRYPSCPWSGTGASQDRQSEGRKGKRGQRI